MSGNTLRSGTDHVQPDLPQSLARLNSIPHDEARLEFLKCCGCAAWTQRMASERPFQSIEHLSETADRLWWALEPNEWLEAFHSHPKIGGKKTAARVSADAQKWSEAEQSGTRDSNLETMEALAQLNEEFEQKFGYIFIICATGKTSEEMLDALRQRLSNGPEEELRIAVKEQAKITRLRLAKLLGAV